MSSCGPARTPTQVPGALNNGVLQPRRPEQAYRIGALTVRIGLSGFIVICIKTTWGTIRRYHHAISKTTIIGPIGFWM